MDHTECEGCKDFGRLEECERKVTGLPDWGSEGDRHCYACGEPLEEDTVTLLLDYNDPLAAVLGKCDICGAPRYEVLGHCPACKGPVYELADHFACYNTFSGTCDFRIPIARMEECEFEPFYISMKHLLHGGLQVTDCDAEEGSRITHAILIRAKDGEWEILIADGVLPQCYAIGHRTPIGYAVGSCPACGDSVIDQGDRFACSSGVSGCNFSIAKKSILDSVSSSIIDELHDAIIGSDSLLAENMSNVLASGGTHKTSWYDYEIYEYYEMAVMKKGDGWTLKITHDDAELEACAREGYRKMLEE